MALELLIGTQKVIPFNNGPFITFPVYLLKSSSFSSNKYVRELQQRNCFFFICSLETAATIPCFLSSQLPLITSQMNILSEFLFNINSCSLLANMVLYCWPHMLLPLNYPIYPQLSPSAKVIFCGTINLNPMTLSHQQ
jgi:hypothetical protein